MSITIFDDELTLPGVITQVVPDFISGYDTSAWNTTESVTIIGTAFNGPVGTPTAVYTPEQAKYIFGDSFDPATKREASLVPAIYDAWDKGCRTIYAVRVSGKEMYKDYELATQTNLKLRLNGAFPCNENKSCYMTYQVTQGSQTAFGESEGVIRIYKPADRTVISEKIAGIVDSLDSILVTEINLDSNGFSKNSRLCDVIDLVNNTESNNVLTLSLVDEQGIPRTNATKEVQEIPIGALFPGIYTICRDKAAKDVKLITDIEIVRSTEETNLYPGYDQKLWKKLIINTDPSQPYPIGSELLANLQSKFPVGITIDENYDFLRKTDVIDAIALKNNIDYEEVDLDPFELYKKLGSGFVRTAKLKEIGIDTTTGEKKYKVIPSPDGDEYRVQGIEDGVYSTLQMHETDYTVLVAATAETKISNKLPKKNLFKKAQRKNFNLTDDDGETIIIVSSLIDEKDIVTPKTNYIFKIEKLSNDNKPTSQDVINKLSNEKHKRLYTIEKDITEKVIIKGLKNGLLIFNKTDSKLYKVVDNELILIDPEIIANCNILINDSEKSNSNYLSVYKYDSSSKEYVPCVGNDMLSKGSYISAMCKDENIIYKLLNKEGNELSESDATQPVYALPYMSLQDLVDGVLDEDDTILVASEPNLETISLKNEEYDDKYNVSYINIYSNEIEYCTVEEFVNTLNEHAKLSNRFKFESEAEKNTSDMPEKLNCNITESFNKKDGFNYDTSLHLAYTTTDNFARQLAQHCLYTGLKTYPTHGIIGCERLAGISLNTIADRINEICSMNLEMYAKKSNGNNMLDSKNVPHPIGRCLSITFMQYTVTTGNGYNYVSSGAAGYAGMISTLSPDRSSTNQPISINQLMFSLSNYQLTKLNSAGIVCCRESTNGMVVVDGITQAPATSAYRRLSTTKIINAIGRILKEVIQPYIGLPQTLAYLNSMETAIKSSLNRVVGVLINDYNYEVITDANAAKLGIVKIDYTIVPAYEIREVRNTVTITSTNQ